MPLPLFRDWPHKPATLAGFVVYGVPIASSHVLCCRPSASLHFRPLPKLIGFPQRLSESNGTTVLKCRPDVHERLIRNRFALKP